MYFDAGRFQEAAEWYEAALKINPKDVNASTDLGIAYYYMNQPDQALAQFDRSLVVDPHHAKTLLNIGIVRAFGKQDLKGAAEVWQHVLAVAPRRRRRARRGRRSTALRSAHPDLGIPRKPGIARPMAGSIIRLLLLYLRRARGHAAACAAIAEGMRAAASSRPPPSRSCGIRSAARSSCRRRP